MEEQIWYYTRGDGENYGPYTEEELVQLIQQGILTAEDYIWMNFLTEWILIGDSLYSQYLPNRFNEVPNEQGMPPLPEGNL